MKQPEYSCVVVDDEPIARRVVKGYLQNLPQYNVNAEFGDAFQLLSYLKENQIDLLFLDIKMPGLNGLEFLRSLPVRPKVILITAFREYALEGFDLEVVDYLLKPVDQSRFLKALNRFEERISKKSLPADLSPDSHIFIKADRKTHKVTLSQLHFIESQGDYVLFHWAEEELKSKMNLSDLANNLPAHFIQTHRSFVVNANFIKAFTNEEVELPQARVPVGRSFREQALKALRG